MIRALALISLRDWRLHKLRLVLTTAGVALGVAVFFALQTTKDALGSDLNTTIEKLAGRATLQVTVGEAGFPIDVIDVVRQTPGVAVAEPVVEIYASTAPGDERLLVLGLDTASDLGLYTDTVDQNSLIIKNPLAFTNRPDSVAITGSFARRHGLKNGDKFAVTGQ